MYIYTPGDALGSEPTLPYLSPELKGDRLLVGANFASAGIGILNDTGIQFVCPEISFSIFSNPHMLEIDIVPWQCDTV